MSHDPIWFVLSDFPSRKIDMYKELWLLEHGFRPLTDSLAFWSGWPDEDSGLLPADTVFVSRADGGWVAWANLATGGRAVSEMCETPEEALCGLYGKCVKEENDHE